MTGSLQTKHKKYYVVARIQDGDGGIKSKWIPTGISSEGNHKREAQKKRLEILAQLEEELKQVRPKHDTTFAYYVNG